MLEAISKINARPLAKVIGTATDVEEVPNVLNRHTEKCVLEILVAQIRVAPAVPATIVTEMNSVKTVDANGEALVVPDLVHVPLIAIAKMETSVSPSEVRKCVLLKGLEKHANQTMIAPTA